jgi:hypothetical protein
MMGDTGPNGSETPFGEHMALITRASTCCICHRTLEHAQIVAFPPFVRLRGDPLGALSDAAAHRACFEQYSGRANAEKILEALQAASEGTAACVICHQPVRKGTPGAFHSGYLGVSACAQRFGLLSFHAHCYPNWGLRADFETCLLSIIRASNWAGGGLSLRPTPQWRPRKL